MRLLTISLLLFSASAQAASSFIILGKPGQTLDMGCQQGYCSVGKIIKVKSTALPRKEVRVDAVIRPGSIDTNEVENKVDWDRPFTASAVCSHRRPRVIWAGEAFDIPSIGRVYEAIRAPSEFYYQTCYSRSTY